MADTNDCVLCGAPNASIQAVPDAGAWRVDCSTCGCFAVEMGTRYKVHKHADDGYRLSALAREACTRGRPVLFVDGSIQPIVEGFESLQIPEALKTRFPRTISELLDRALLNLSRLSEHPGFELNFLYEKEHAVFFARNAEEAAFYAKALMKAGWLDYGLRDEPDRECFIGSVSPKGLVRVAELQAGRVGEPLTQAFVAMWFGNERDQIGDRSSAEFCTEAFRSGFTPGINKAGYAERRIDFKEFNDDVMDEIVTEIRRSKFIVADFTGHRAGVYYEAGFARGLGIPVIFTCHKDHVESAHFDTSHMNHLTWSSFDELAKKLERRIVATIGQGPLAAQRVAEKT